MSSVYLGIGSNINPEANLRAAASRLREVWPEIEFASVYHSAPTDIEDQDFFLNTVARVETNDAPVEVYQVTHEIELALGKNPPFKFGPRTIDIDILLIDDETIKAGTVIIPHPRMHQRQFVLAPLTELIDPESLHPTLGNTWSELAKGTVGQDCTKTNLQL